MSDHHQDSKRLLDELSMLSDVRRRLKESLGDETPVPTRVVDEVLDEYNNALRSERSSEHD